MPRTARIDAPGALHHVIIRGIERRKIFLDDRDYADFLDRLADLIPATNTTCLAWVLMTNHAHFLLRSGPDGLSGFMRRLLTGYAVKFNRRHKRHGQLFQNRYKSILCQEDIYLKELLRYIHLNPLRVGMVECIETLKEFRYSGHGVLLGSQKRPWQETGYVLDQFGGTVPTARRRYLSYVRAGVDQGRREDLTGGGLIRSLGGWSAVKRQRRQKMGRLKGDERILGDPEFVHHILEQASEQLERGYELASRGWDKEKVARQVASLYNISPEEIYRKGRQQIRMEARSLFCYWCSRELSLSLSDIAKALSMTPAGVGYAVRRGEKITLDKGLRLKDLDTEIIKDVPSNYQP
jgi:REP element-mobilizing transposase RayT